MKSCFSGFHQKPDYQNQQVTQINRELSHSPWGSYASVDQARKRADSPYRISLDGEWRFCLAENPDAVPSDFYLPGNQVEWKPIQVPGNWELQGFSAPVYTNVLYPFPRESEEDYLLRTSSEAVGKDYNFPNIPRDMNRVGLYSRGFSVPDAFAGRRTYLCLEGVESAYYLYVNGRAVGYSQDSKLPGEFDVTDHLQPGENTVALAVFRFCDGTWLEDQDYFHLSGIYRGVSLVSKPAVHIRDWKVDGEPDVTLKNGALTARCFVNREECYGDYRVRLSLYDPTGNLCLEQTARIDTEAPIYGMGTGWHVKGLRPLPQCASFEAELKDIRVWNVDDPALYTAVFTLLSPEGIEVDFESQRMGFRKIRIEQNVIRLNGKRVVFRGVNRHEHAWPTGRTVSREHMVKEIRLMKQLNFNAVRTSHYPDMPLWYDLCDEYGLMVVCETNLETHGVAGAITNHPDWAEAMLERAKRMVLTHKNHPCIVSWSLGNESGYGPNHAAMAGWIREYDSTRLVQYENNDPGQIASDIKCTMYPPIDRLLSMIADNDDRRPIVLVEYAYQISNTTGGYGQFNELAEKYDIFQGGFVWDWQDKCLPARAEDGTEFFGIGGDWGEDVVDWNVPVYMCANGVVLPDLTPKPCAWEMKQGHTPVIVELVNADSGCCILKNRTQGIPTYDLEVRYELMANGKALSSGICELLDCSDNRKVNRLLYGDQHQLINAPVKLGEGESLFVVDLAPAKGVSHELHLNLSVHTLRKYLWAERGQCITQVQAELKGPAPVPSLAKVAEALQISEEPGRLLLSGKGFSVAFDLRNNLLQSCEKNGELYLISGGREEYSRARSGLHLEGRWWGEAQKHWSAFEPGKLSRQAMSSEWWINGDHTSAVVSMVSCMKGDGGEIVTTATYKVNGAGVVEIEVTAEIDENYRQLPRVGLEFIVPAGFEQLEWYGRGPGESYCDRTASAPVGHYRGTVEEMHFPFIPVSHNGTHVDTRWLRLENGKRSITICGSRFGFDAHHNTVEEYWNTLHEHELTRREDIYLHIDGYHSGIGGDMAWSTEINSKHMLGAGSYRYGLRITFE